MTIGIFTLTGSPSRWEVTNIRTGVTHVTYGDEVDVVASLERQSEAWARRMGPKARRVKQGKSGQWRARPKAA